MKKSKIKIQLEFEVVYNSSSYSKKDLSINIAERSKELLEPVVNWSDCCEVTLIGVTRVI